jgi:hypothetical protein
MPYSSGGRARGDAAGKVRELLLDGRMAADRAWQAAA